MKEELRKIIISAILFAIALIVPFSNIWINRAIFIISYIIVGFEVIKEGIENIKEGEIFGEELLMAIATIGAFAIGDFAEAVAVMLFFEVGELLEDYAVDKSKKSISELMDIRPDFANVLKDGKAQKVNPADVKIGEQIVVKPGEKVPLDGKVIEGTAMLDTMALTGESVPRRINIGEEILSGCINKDGVIKVEVQKEFGESTVTKILDLVENASNKKSKSENFITKFAKYYTPTVVIIAFILAILPPIILEGETFAKWIYRALSFLVVSCPCALVISIPLGFFGGIGGASRKGILIKGSNYLEALSKTGIVVFDKTGTLTKGVFKVQKVCPTQNISSEQLLEIVAFAENYSNHPIAKSVKEAYGKNIDESKITKVNEISGHGISANIEEKEILVGNEKLMNEKGIKFEKCKEVGTILYVVINNQFAGYILISDEIKEDSVKTIKDLKKNKIRKTVMLTGDRKEVAEDVAKKLEIDEVYSELLPDGKVKKVEEMIKEKDEKENLSFVGDGINDAPVLALSDIGIAMGGLGSDSAIEAADIVLMTDEPSKINEGIALSKKTMRIVKENIIFAILVKVLVLVLSAMGIATMWEAVFADVGVSIIAILNALRVLRK